MSKIERSNTPGRWSESEIRAAVAETKRRMAQPGYAAAEAKRIAEAEKRAKSRGQKFPELAKRGGTKPVVARNREYWKARLGLLEKNTPKI